MLSKERIKELNNQIEDGKKAEETLDEYYQLERSLEYLEGQQKYSDRCTRITFNGNRSFDIEEVEKNTVLLKQMIQNEIDAVKKEMDKFE